MTYEQMAAQAAERALEMTETSLGPREAIRAGVMAAYGLTYAVLAVAVELAAAREER